MHVSRREFIAASAAAPLALEAQKRPRLAAVCTIYFKMSHAQHIVGRFLEGYGWNGTHHHPPMDLMSLYVNQIGKDDLSRERAARFPGMKMYPTIAEALTLGGSKLAVDGVVLVGGHGHYHPNDNAPTKMPPHHFFHTTLTLFRRT